MTISLPYDAATIAALDRLTTALLRQFVEFGATRIEPAIVQPADVFLERTGEDLRRRIYTFPGPSGSELCLRPDLTIPTALAYLNADRDASRPCKLCYAGPVFRYGSGSAGTTGQTWHAGVEYFGADDAAQADASLFTLAHRALAEIGAAKPTARLGDLSIFGELLTALKIPPHWAARLYRHVWRPAYMSKLMEAMTGDQVDDAMLRQFAGLSATEVIATLEQHLAALNILHLGNRTMEEIAERIAAKSSELVAPRLSTEAAQIIVKYLAIKTPAMDTVRVLQELATAAGVDLHGTISGLERRLALIAAGGFDLTRAQFVGEFGRKMEYYTGFVFEFLKAGMDKPIAGGGRYDSLLKDLGAPKQMPSVGLAIFVERLL